MYIRIYVYKRGYTCATNPGKTPPPDSQTFEDINLKKRRRRGFTLKCTASAPGGELDDSGKNEHATNTLKYARRRVTPAHEESASEEGWLCINRRSVWNTNSNVTRLTSARKKRNNKSRIDRRKIRIIYIKDRENMIKFTSQIVSGYTSYIHLCIHKDMYSGHLEGLFTLRSKVIVR